MSTLMTSLTSSYQEEEKTSRSTSPASSIFNGDSYEIVNPCNSQGMDSKQDQSQSRQEWDPTISEISTSQSSTSSSAATFGSESMMNSSMLVSSASNHQKEYYSQESLAFTTSDQDCWAFKTLNNIPLDSRDVMLRNNGIYQGNQDQRGISTVNPSNVWKPDREEKNNAMMMSQYHQLPPPPPITFLNDDVYSMGDNFTMSKDGYSQQGMGVYDPPPMMRSRLGDARPVVPKLEDGMSSYMLTGSSRLGNATVEQLQAIGYTSQWEDTRGSSGDQNPSQSGRAFYEIIGGNKKRKGHEQVLWPRVKMEDEEIDELASDLEDEPSSSTSMLPPQQKTSSVGKTDRAKNACTQCHRRKTKCTEERPICARCRQVGAECEYPKEVRRRGKGKNKTRGESISTNRSYSAMPSQDFRRLSSIALASELAVAAISSPISSGSSSTSSKKRKSE